MSMSNEHVVLTNSDGTPYQDVTTPEITDSTMRNYNPWAFYYTGVVTPTKTPECIALERIATALEEANKIKRG